MIHLYDTENIGATMSGELTDVEKLILAKLDKLTDELTGVRVKIASMAVIISLATSFITATVMNKSKELATQPAIIDHRKE